MNNERATEPVREGLRSIPNTLCYPTKTEVGSSSGSPLRPLTCHVRSCWFHSPSFQLHTYTYTYTYTYTHTHTHTHTHIYIYIYTPPKGCMTLIWWWGLCVSMIHQAIPAVACYWQGLPCRADWWWEARRRSNPSILQDCWELIVGLITLHRKTITITKPYMPRDVRRQLRKRNMKFNRESMARHWAAAP
jgi:hypothetical protein